MSPLTNRITRHTGPLTIAILAGLLITTTSANAAVVFEIFDKAPAAANVNASTFVTSSGVDPDPTPQAVTTTLTRNTGSFGASSGATADTLGASGGNGATFDGGNTAGVPNERASITFDQPVIITSLKIFVESNRNAVRNWSSGDVLYIKLPGQAAQTISYAGANSSGLFTFGELTGDFTGNVTIDIGQTIDFGAHTGSFRLDAFTVEVIPEPASLVLLVSGVALVVSRRRC